MLRQQRGAALVVALILLAALALLSLAGLGSAAVAFVVASHDLRRAQAFEAAERATLAVLAGGNWPAPGAGIAVTVMPAATPGVEASARHPGFVRVRLRQFCDQAAGDHHGVAQVHGVACSTAMPCSSTTVAPSGARPVAVMA